MLPNEHVLKLQSVDPQNTAKDPSLKSSSSREKAICIVSTTTRSFVGGSTMNKDSVTPTVKPLKSACPNIHYTDLLMGHTCSQLYNHTSHYRRLFPEVIVSAVGRRRGGGFGGRVMGSECAPRPGLMSGATMGAWSSLNCCRSSPQDMMH